MKKANFLLTLSMMAAFLIFTGCGSDDGPAPTFTLVSLTAGDIDLAGVTSAADVPEDADIVAVFSSDVDEATISGTTITVTDGDGEAAAYTLNVSGATVTLTPTNGWDGGSQFSIAISADISGANGVSFDGNTLTFRTSGIFVPNKEDQVLHISFDNSTVADDGGSNTVSTVGTMTFETDRRGTANAAGYFDGQGNIVEVAESASLVEGSVTVSYWFKTSLADYSGAEGSGHPQTRFLMGLGVEKGYFLEVGRRSNDPTADGFGRIFLKYATNHVNVGTNAASVPEATSWTELNADRVEDDLSDPERGSGFSYVIDALEGDGALIANTIDNTWTHIAMVIDGSAQTKTIFINGEKWTTFEWKSSGHDWLFGDLSLKDINNDGSPNDAVEGSLALGFAGSSTNEGTGWANHTTNLSNDAEQKKFFKGSMDEFRVFSTPFSDADIAELYNSEK